MIRKTAKVICAVLLTAAVMLFFPAALYAEGAVSVCVIIDNDSINGASDGSSVLNSFVSELSENGLKATFFIDAGNTEYSTDYINAMNMLYVHGLPCGIYSPDGSDAEKWLGYQKIASGSVSRLLMTDGSAPDGFYICPATESAETKDGLTELIKTIGAGETLAFRLNAETARDFGVSVINALSERGLSAEYITWYGQTRSAAE